MKNPMDGKRIVLGVTGSIACYKAVDLCSKLVKSGAIVDVILSKSAAQFVTELTFSSITHRPIVTTLFDVNSTMGIEHVELARSADVVIIAPATANTIAKLSIGLADDPLTTTVLATEAPIMIAPAMDGHMYENPATQDNLATLKRRGVIVIGPESGHLASGLAGWGRMVEPVNLLGHIAAALGRNGDLSGKRIVISAGGTLEAIDPIRVITNRSSGKMGYAIAEAARDRGAQAILITTPTALNDPTGVEIYRVENTVEMQSAITRSAKKAHALIMAAAVADYRAMTPNKQKIKKGTGDRMVLELTKNPDILAEAQGPEVKVGFAAETKNLLANARQKLINKNVDLFVANDVTSTGAGFGSDTNKVTILDQNNGIEDIPLMTKYEVAHRILDRVVDILKQKS